MVNNRHCSPVFFFDAGPEGFTPPVPRELPPGSNPVSKQEKGQLPKSKVEEIVDTIAADLGTEGVDLTVTIAKVAGRTDELSAGHADTPAERESTQPQEPKELVATNSESEDENNSSEPTQRSLEDIVAHPDMDSMRQLEGRIIVTTEGPMVIGKVQINIGSGEMGVLAHPFGVETDDASTTRLSLAKLRSGEISEMTDEEYLASDVEQADITEAVQAIADDSEARAFVTADISELVTVLADKKGNRLDFVIDRAKTYQEAESPTIKTYGIDLEMSTLQLKQDGLIRQTQKKPQQAEELQPQMNEITARLAELKTMREEFATEQNQIAEMGKRLGVVSDKADAAPLIALRDLVQTTAGRKQIMEKLEELSGDSEQFHAMHESVKAIAKHEKLKSRAQMAGLSVGILMAIMAGMVAMMASGRR